MPSRRARNGLSLLELVAVLTLIGVFAAIGAARFGPSAGRNFSSGGDARRLALDLLQCQRRAISNGANHYVEFTSSSGSIVGYTLYRRTSPSTGTAVDAYRDFPQGETVTTSHTQLEYQFDGSALAAYVVTFTGPNRSTQVSVVPASGGIRVQ